MAYKMKSKQYNCQITDPVAAFFSLSLSLQNQAIPPASNLLLHSNREFKCFVVLWACSPTP